MATTMNLRKILDRKQWEFCTPAPVATAAGTFIVSSRHFRQFQYYVVNATTIWVYLPEEDAWEEMPSPALGGTFGVGACGVCTPTGQQGTAISGTSTTISTNLNLQRSLNGYKVRILSGTNAGEERVIKYNTVGANSTITVENPYSSAITNTSVYQLLYTRVWLFNAHTAAPAANQFKYYDFGLNTWTSAALPGVAGAWGTDGRLVATPSIVDFSNHVFMSGTVASASTNSISAVGVKNWTKNQFANAYQMRITSGAGRGQIRNIISNTPSTITVENVFSPALDNTSTYVIEGCDDYLYLMGGNAVTMYRYKISTNTWSTLSPGVARGAAPGAGMNGHWIWGCDDIFWNSENSLINGRRIYSHRGGGSTVYDYYDIPSNTWSATSYSPSVTTFTTGSKHTIIKGRYIWTQKESTNRFYRFDPVKFELDPGAQFLYPQGVAVVGDTCFDVEYVDGDTTITWIYIILNTSQVMLRMMLV